MGYRRVIPRDLFNEANLLKCLGALYIALDRLGTVAGFTVEDVESFRVEQNPDDGSIYVANLPFAIDGHPFHLSRPLNSRQPWPLWIVDHNDRDFEPVLVFDDQGNLSGDFLDLIPAPDSEGEQK